MQIVQFRIDRALSGAPVVVVLIDGRRALEMPPKAAREVVDVFRQVVGKAEQLEQPERAIADQAALLRAGAPIDITGHSALLGEARKLNWGIASAEAVGRPSVRRGTKAKGH